jgi:uncharacterized protein (DUF362 family)
MAPRSGPRSGSTRREFLFGAALGVGVLGMPALAYAQQRKRGPGTVVASPAAATRFEARGTVVRVRRDGVLGAGGRPSPEALDQMIERALMELTGQSKAADAWAQFVQPTDKVLIKPNAFGFPAMAAHPEVAFAVVRGLRSIGVPEENIVIYDQYQSRMAAARYKITPPTAKGVRVLSSKQAPYEPTFRRHAMGKTKLALPLLEANVVIDIPVIKDHDLSGVTCAMKNMTHGVTSNPSAHHSGGCAAIPAVWAIPEIKDKVKLVLCDGLRLLCDGGPHDRPQNKVPFGSLFATTDPVAMDRLAWEFIDEVRKGKGKKSLAQVGRPPRFIEAAAAQGLGVGARGEIKLVEAKG